LLDFITTWQVFTDYLLARVFPFVPRLFFSVGRCVEITHFGLGDAFAIQNLWAALSIKGEEQTGRRNVGFGDMLKW